ncbi:NUDIX domain-containing protein [Candidatus Pacearchaeota archaeon]|nr:NUDIX domain-containing protein [Candidatus Pacearchaeota archaeon]
MGNKKEDLHYVAATGIIVKDEKYLITKRSLSKKAFPGKWTVPGGNLEKVDYINKPKDTSSHWYNVIETVLRREIMEEVGLEISNIGYLTSLSFINDGIDNIENIPMLVLSFYADYLKGDVKLNEESCDYKWVSLKEALEYDLIEGIYEELVMLDKLLKEKKLIEWAKDLERN